MATHATTLRTLSDSAELPSWFAGVAAGFLRAGEITKEEWEARAGHIDLDRTQGAYDGDRCVATCRTFAQELTVPGGALVRSSAVTSVTVQPTHRRRGLLSRMMVRALDAAKERGDLCSTLIAAEYPIYGRFGYGSAAFSADFEVDLVHSGLDRNRPVDTGDGRIELVSTAELTKLGPELYERVRALPHHAGHVDRTPHFWRLAAGELRYPNDGYTEQFHAVYRDAAGTVQGMASYEVKSRWDAEVPRGTVEVSQLHAATPTAERVLWNYLFRIDWTVTVRAARRAPDDVLPLLLPDPRAARTTSNTDYLWLRPLDVPALLTSRRYGTDGSLVLEVRDDAGYAAGRYRLEATADGSSCVPTKESAELTVPVGELGAMFLGDESAGRLLWLGRLDEHRTGAADRAGVLLRTARRPWCPDMF